MTENPFSTFHVKYPLFHRHFEPWRVNHKKEYPTQGFYILKTSVSVPRESAIDTDAILYIAYGPVLNNGNNRLIQLVDALNGSDLKHKAGVWYNDQDYDRYYPLDTLTLYIELTRLNKMIVHELLQRYQHKFGELPLLNQCL